MQLPHLPILARHGQLVRAFAAASVIAGAALLLTACEDARPTMTDAEAQAAVAACARHGWDAQPLYQARSAFDTAGDLAAVRYVPHRPAPRQAFAP